MAAGRPPPPPRQTGRQVFSLQRDATSGWSGSEYVFYYGAQNPGAPHFPTFVSHSIGIPDASVGAGPSG